MISLSCPSCQKKLQVKDESAGKKVRCPDCKQALEIPKSDAQPKNPADGEQVRESLKAEANYQVEGEIARGGMGAIMRAVDQDIRREVAVKFLLNQADAKQKARFVEEAQITGQLEHPNIVPIHQLGVHHDGRCFFSMKMVRGRSLGKIVKEPRADDTLGRQLTIFVSICNAMAYAHSRQVIHRDLKPANIMIGDFGEVYVMDWGLAKVLGKETGVSNQESGIREHQSHIQQTKSSPDIVQPSNSTDSKSGDKISTYRQTVGDLTQDGAIMGTVAYMPPEQARGDDLDERADIYSLGAILYEIMTLTPPVGRGGEVLAILMRVVDGQIDPPPQRSPERAKAGWIPAELSAIALKALAKEPANRYQTVETLRRDVELFLEGRSVSAKQDSLREMAWKLVKRNKGASITAATAVVVLTLVAGVFLKINYDARLLAERNYQAYQDQVKDSVPAFLRAAKLALGERQFDDALVQASLAAKSAPDNAEARLLKGELLITRKCFADAIPELEEYQKLGPDKAAAPKLVELCRKAQLPDTEETASLLAFADIFTRAQDHALADGVLGNLGLGKDAREVRQRILEIYRKRIDDAWPGKGKNLTMSVDGRYSLQLNNEKITDLSPLQGIPLSTLELMNNDQIRDLMPLKGMPLTTLKLTGCSQVRSLEPLKGMPLTGLFIDKCTQIEDLAPLKSTPLSGLDLTGCTKVWLESVKGTPLTWLSLNGCGQVRDLEPLQGMPITYLSLGGTQVRDLAPLNSTPIALLDLGFNPQVQLESLKGLRLTSLSISLNGNLGDLEPLRGMPLSKLYLFECPGVRDLEPLKGMPLTDLTLQGCKRIKDLAPLKEARLTKLGLGGCVNVQDLEPLRGMPLTNLVLWGTGVRDLELLKGMPLRELRIEGCEGVSDLRALQNMHLEQILFTPMNITQGLDVLRDMNSLKTIGIVFGQAWPAAEFWKKYDAGEFKK